MKIAVTIERSAYVLLTYHVEAPTHDAAEAIVQSAIDANNMDPLGTPVNVTHVDDEDSSWDVIAAENVP